MYVARAMGDLNCITKSSNERHGVSHHRQIQIVSSIACSGYHVIGGLFSSRPVRRTAVPCHDIIMAKKFYTNFSLIAVNQVCLLASVLSTGILLLCDPGIKAWSRQFGQNIFPCASTNIYKPMFIIVICTQVWLWIERNVVRLFISNCVSWISYLKRKKYTSR